MVSFSFHVPVLVEEILDMISPVSGGTYVDMTVGDGGHAEAILKASSPDGILFGFDKDEEAIRRSKERLEPLFDGRVILINADYRNCSYYLNSYNVASVDGIIADLGVSSLQVDDPERGFSFSKDGPLDMRMSRSQNLKASDVVNSLSETELANILKLYSDERFCRRIARAIVKERKRSPILTTSRLASIVSGVYGNSRGRIHPATRTFQALRIFVNDEVEGLKEMLVEAVDLLSPGGVLCVISFHSVEDRIVKHTFKRFVGDGVVELLNKKPVTPSEEEVKSNPRARSAKMRCIRKLKEMLS